MSSDTETLQQAKEILDTMLGYLNFVVQVEIDDSAPVPGLQVYTADSELLIGKEGERLEDIQYLLNRLLHQQNPSAPRIRVDVEHFRSMSEDSMIAKIQALADQVRRNGKPIELRPMNSYLRRLVHNAFKDDPMIETWSPKNSARVKRITLIKRGSRNHEGHRS